MVECTCFCYIFSGGKFYFVTVDNTKGSYKVPTVFIDEESGNPDDLLIDEMGKLGLKIDRSKLVPFEQDVETKKLALFAKTVVTENMVKGLSVVGIESLFNNVSREQFKSFIKLLSIMKKSEGFVMTEISFFQKMADLRENEK